MEKYTQMIDSLKDYANEIHTQSERLFVKIKKLNLSKSVYEKNPSFLDYKTDLEQFKASYKTLLDLPRPQNSFFLELAIDKKIHTNNPLLIKKLYQFEVLYKEQENRVATEFGKIIEEIGTTNEVVPHYTHNKINLDNTSKPYLLTELVNRLDRTCKTQTCLLREEFVRQTGNFDLTYNTLRPKGPKRKLQWLSSSDIDQIMLQYVLANKDFEFFGAVPLDFEKIKMPIDFSNFNTVLTNLNKANKHKIGMVFNLDKHNQPGSHWTALYADIKKNQIYFFDSTGYKPENEIMNLKEQIKKWCITNNPNKKVDMQWNQVKHQFKNSECGVYSVNFIIRMLKGDSFNKISNNPTFDDDINKCRDTYFRFN